MSFEGFKGSDSTGIYAVKQPIDEAKYNSLENTIFAAENIFKPAETGSFFGSSCVGFGVIDDNRYMYDKTNYILFAFGLGSKAWVQTAVGPDLQDGKVVGTHNNKVYLYGGNDDNYGSIWTYTPSTDLWEELSTVATSWNGGTGILMSEDNAIYLFGGKVMEGVYSHDIKRYDLTTGVMTATNAVLPVGLAYATVVKYSATSMMLVGGVMNPTNNPSNIFMYNIALDTCAELDDTPTKITNLIPQSCANGFSVHGGTDITTGLPNQYIGINILDNAGELTGWRWLKTTLPSQSIETSMISGNNVYLSTGGSIPFISSTDSYEIVTLKG